MANVRELMVFVALKASCGRSKDIDETALYLAKTSYRQLLTVGEEVYLRIPPVSRFRDHDDGLLYFGTFCRLESRNGASAKELILYSIRGASVYNGTHIEITSPASKEKENRDT